ncbi:hypothetical protein OF83DRAFT_1023268, partial [Amylostereum chailletii]
PECLPLHLPSSMSSAWQSTQTEVAQQELQLWVDVLNDTIGGIRSSIAKMSFQYIQNIRAADSQKQTTRSFDALNASKKALRHQVQIYSDGRLALEHLSAPDDVMQKYRRLSHEDLAISTAIIDPSNPHTIRDKLSWI